MTVLVVGASGATGKQLVEQLLIEQNKIKIIVRSPNKLPETWQNNKNLEIISASILDLTDEALSIIVSDCNAVVSCLGHNLSLNGIYGKPRRLVKDATRKLCVAIQNNITSGPIKFILMNTTGNQNRDLNESISFAQKMVVGLIRLLLPPHVDNEQAADFLRIEIGQNNKCIEWVAVRPDGLTNEEEVTAYEVYPSPIRSAIFNAGKTSRINVGRFMSSLLNNDDLWLKWKGQMPVIYNQASLEKK